jgi:hypothetical protein
MTSFDVKSGFEDSLQPVFEHDSPAVIADADPGDEQVEGAPIDAAALLGDLHTYIVSSLDLAEWVCQNGHNSRELRHAITRLEEAEFWVLKGTLPREDADNTEPEVAE